MSRPIELSFYRLRAGEATRQAEAACQPAARERCQAFALWWSAIGDAVEAGDTRTATELTHNVVHFQS